MSLKRSLSVGLNLPSAQPGRQPLIPHTPYILLITPSDALTKLLEAQGFRVTLVSSLEAAQRAANTIIPDLVVIDQQLLAADPSRLFELRKHPALPFIPIILWGDQPISAELVGIVDGLLRRQADAAEVINQIYLGLNLSQTRRDLVQQSQHVELLYEVSKALHRSLDLEQVLQQTLQLISAALRASKASMFLFDPAGQVWRTFLLRDLTQAAATAAVKQVLEDGLAAHALREGCVQIVADTRRDPRWRTLDPDEDIGSALALPLRDHQSERYLGVMILVHPAPHHFTETIRPLAAALTEQLEVALSNATVHTRLRQAEESREAFIQMLTHDLRAPLAGMISCFDALLTTKLDSDGQLFVDLGLQAGSAQQRLIDDLLDVYRAETGAMVLHRAKVSLAAMRVAVQEQMGARAVDSGLQLIIDLPAEPLVWLDEHKIVRVLANLISNSIKWTERGGSITVTGTVTPSTVVLQVADTGVGIAPEDRPHIFDRFYQGRIRGSARGTGLGLTFCLLAVQAHSGKIDIDSTVGMGTTVTLQLPREED